MQYYYTNLRDINRNVYAVYLYRKFGDIDLKAHITKAHIIKAYIIKACIIKAYIVIEKYHFDHNITDHTSAYVRDDHLEFRLSYIKPDCFPIHDYERYRVPESVSDNDRYTSLSLWRCLPVYRKRESYRRRCRLLDRDRSSNQQS